MKLPNLSGRPVGVLLALAAAATWALGTQQLRKTTMPVAATLSVMMMIPILGVCRRHWQDWAAVLLVVMALGAGHHGLL